MRMKSTGDMPVRAIKTMLLVLYSVILFGVGLLGLLCVLSPCVLVAFLGLPQPEPTREDIVGVWVPTPESILLMKQKGYRTSTHVMEFKEDGTFVMTNMPDCWQGWGGFYEPKGRFDSGLGVWEVSEGAWGGWHVMVHFTGLNGAETDFGTSFDLGECWISPCSYSISFPIENPASGPPFGMLGRWASGLGLEVPSVVFQRQ